MSGKGNKNRNNNRDERAGKGQQPTARPAAVTPPATTPQPVVAADPRVEAITTAHAEALTLGVQGAATAPPPRPPEADLEHLWRLLDETRKIWSEDRIRLTELQHQAREAEASARAVEAAAKKEKDDLGFERLEIAEEHAKMKADRASLDQARANLGVDQKELERVRASLNQDREALQRRAGDLATQEARLRQRELNAEAGFVTEREAALAELERASTRLREQISATEADIARQRAASLTERAQAREALQRELEAERSRHAAGLATEREAHATKLREERDRLLTEHQTAMVQIAQARAKAQAEAEAQENALRQRERTLDQRARELAWTDQDLEDLKRDLDLRVHARVTAAEETFASQLAAEQARLDAARADRDALAARLLAREEADRRFGQRSPDELIAELDALRAERDQLRRDLVTRLEPTAAAELDALKGEQSRWVQTHSVLIRERAELEGRLARMSAGVIELETLRDQKLAAESGRAALQAALEELRREVDQLIQRAEGKRSFPACQAMDEDGELQTSRELDDESPRNLASFVQDLQHRIALDPEHPDRRLYYGLDDLRLFLGGLAMGPLLLLQGISGIGKTSLPVAFARALGTRATVVEVQAGWRDPQDLIGHFNEFEKKFRESELLKALYRAQTPRWRDGVHLVVLDEMNLSHPEQYFSDFLSVLERRHEGPTIPLVSHAVNPAPSLLVEGHRLRLPPNVWFVGTANQDETTKEFADKTYDRAMVIELPPAPPHFDPKQHAARPPISFTALTRSFERASKERADDAKKVSAFLHKHVKSSLAHDFGVGWGPRLERQIERFVPVVTASGGSLSEAADALLAGRLLRKLKGRHDNRREHVERLHEDLGRAKTELGKGAELRRSLALLEGEITRLGGDASGGRRA